MKKNMLIPLIGGPNRDLYNKAGLYEEGDITSDSPNLDYAWSAYKLNPKYNHDNDFVSSMLDAASEEDRKLGLRKDLAKSYLKQRSSNYQQKINATPKNIWQVILESLGKKDFE